MLFYLSSTNAHAHTHTQAPKKEETKEREIERENTLGLKGADGLWMVFEWTPFLDMTAWVWPSTCSEKSYEIILISRN